MDGLIAFDSIPHGIRGTFSAFQIKVIFRDFRKRRVRVDRKAINDKLNEYVSGEDTSLYPQNSLGAAIEDNNRKFRSDAVSHDDFEGRPKSVQEGSTTARRSYPPASQAVTCN